MHQADGKLILTATDLSGYLGCRQLTLLERRRAFGGPKPDKFPDEGVEVLRKLGHKHEQAHLATLRAAGAAEVVEVEDNLALPPRDRWARAAAETIEAMRRGADVIRQGVLFDGMWLGKPDFLVKTDRPSRLGAWSYEVHDAKLAREAKGGALLQVLLYAHLLEQVQGLMPEQVHLVLGGPDARVESFRVADYAAYFRSIKERFLTHVDNGSLTQAPDPVAHCGVCDWSRNCDAERRSVDHLSFVAGITTRHQKTLAAAGITTLKQLAGWDPNGARKLEGVTKVTARRIQEQAAIQLRGREARAHIYELLAPAGADKGLAALPAPSAGDLFFDLEGDPHALGAGLEYLFGFSDAAGEYTACFALDRESEKRAFEQFIDFVAARRLEYPDMHVYHYAPYEPGALKRLMGRYGTREDELDALLRGGVFVDLYRVVKQSVRASVESYSIKKLEPFYGYERKIELREATGALAAFEAWLELGGDRSDDTSQLEAIEAYNRDDCLSTLKLRDWLEGLRGEYAKEFGQELARPEVRSGEPPEDQAERQAAVAALYDKLTSDVPADPEHRNSEQQARWLLAQLLNYHRREARSTYWEYFAALEFDEDGFIDNRKTLGGLEYVEAVGQEKKSLIHRYKFPAQEHDLRPGIAPHDPETRSSAGTVVAIDDLAGTIDLKRGMKSDVPHPAALIPFERVSDVALREAIARYAQAVSESGMNAEVFRCASDLLLRHPPRLGQAPGKPIVRPDEATLDAAVRAVMCLDRSVLPIQGPPGAGKTHTAAHMIVQALRNGKRIGITANSHKVIGNLLKKVCVVAAEQGVQVKGIQKADEDQHCGEAEIARVDDAKAVPAALDGGSATLAAGTAWLWSREDMIGKVDVLFIDEAGQFPLANAIAVSLAADSLVLLGDPQQLEQPIQGSHPEGSDASVLQHLLGDDTTIPADRGIFLGETWRLHPVITRFTSEVFYGGRLKSVTGRHRQAVAGPPPLAGSGLRLISVDHAGNQNESGEEADAVADIIKRLLADRATWVDSDGAERQITLDDILVVAPYNAQVSAIAQRVPGVRVGSVDRFQGQEAPVAIYSLATSTAEDAPRGMRFLYSPNRLNVATSRAKCLAIVVASPALFTPDCRTPEQMRLANAFCRFRELAFKAEPQLAIAQPIPVKTH